MGSVWVGRSLTSTNHRLRCLFEVLVTPRQHLPGLGAWCVRRCSQRQRPLRSCLFLPHRRSMLAGCPGPPLFRPYVAERLAPTAITDKLPSLWVCVRSLISTFATQRFACAPVPATLDSRLANRQQSRLNAMFYLKHSLSAPQLGRSSALATASPLSSSFSRQPAHHQING